MDREQRKISTKIRTSDEIADKLQKEYFEKYGHVGNDFISNWSEKRNKKKQFTRSNYEPVKDREPSPCLECKWIRKSFCTEPCNVLTKWMRKVFNGM